MLSRMFVIESETEETLSCMLSETTSRFALVDLMCDMSSCIFCEKLLKLETTVSISSDFDFAEMRRVKSASPEAMSRRAVAVARIGRTVPRRITASTIKMKASRTINEIMITLAELVTKELTAFSERP